MTTTTADMDVQLKAQMQEACDRIAKGILPTMEERMAAAAKIDRMRNENARRFGIQNVTLDAVHATRHSIVAASTGTHSAIPADGL